MLDVIIKRLFFLMKSLIKSLQELYSSNDLDLDMYCQLKQNNIIVMITSK